MKSASPERRRALPCSRTSTSIRSTVGPHLPIGDAVRDVSKSYLRNAEPRPAPASPGVVDRRAYPPELFARSKISHSICGTGESLAVVGLNGAGKSTLLRLATGISLSGFRTGRVRGTMAALMELGAGFHPDLDWRGKPGPECVAAGAIAQK